MFENIFRKRRRPHKHIFRHHVCAAAKPLPSVGEIISKRRGKIAAVRNIIGLTSKIVLAVIAVWIAVTYVFGICSFSGEGMYPHLRDGDLIVYYRFDENFVIGDIVTFEIDGVRQFARVVACGGDTVDFTQAGQLLVNGNVQQEEMFSKTSGDGKNIRLPITLEKDEVFVLGDNRTRTTDSRDYGPVKFRNIDGKAISILRGRGL